jgi:hypothetical protein
VKYWLGLILMALLAQGAYAVDQTLVWDPVIQDVNGNPTTVSKYTVYRSTDGGETFPVAITVSGSATSFTDKGLPLGDICYEATATNAAGEGTRSNRVCFRVSADSPKAPNLRAQ